MILCVVSIRQKAAYSTTGKIQKYLQDTSLPPKVINDFMGKLEIRLN